jgi:mannose-6-phosphate isomerase-like protein (cupin superfamily)
MNDFPDFMKSRCNAIASRSQSKGVEGYVFDGADGGQMAFWSCRDDGESLAHTHDFDEYFVVIQGEYTVIVNGERTPVRAGEEHLMPRGVTHSGEFVAGTRTIHAFGGRRAERAAQ